MVTNSRAGVNRQVDMRKKGKDNYCEIAISFSKRNAINTFDYIENRAGLQLKRKCGLKRRLKFSRVSLKCFLNSCGNVLFL